jgi:hypothetical protein
VSEEMTQQTGTDEMQYPDRERVLSLVRATGWAEEAARQCWEAYLYRTSVQIGFLMTKEFTGQVWPAFASGMTIFAGQGYAPHMALAAFDSLTMQFKDRTDEERRAMIDAGKGIPR